MKYYWVILFTSFLSINSFGQGFCTAHETVKNTSKRSLSVEAEDSYVVKVFFHIMKSDEGEYGLNQYQIDKALSILKSDFGKHNICVELVGIDEIRSTYIMENYDTREYGIDENENGKFDVMEQYCYQNVIDIFLFSWYTRLLGGVTFVEGLSIAVGSDNNFLENNNSELCATSKVLSHEFGHALGLYHTFHGSSCESFEGTPELVNGSNAEISGDYVTDTPADNSKMFGCIDSSTCKWKGCTCDGNNKDANGDLYAPDTSLIMSYTAPSCMENFTNGQGTRMRNTLANSSLLKGIITPFNKVVSNEEVKSGQKYIFDAQNDLKTDGLVTVESNGKLILKSGNEIVLYSGFTASKQSDFEAVIKASCVNSTSIQSKSNILNGVKHHRDFEGVVVFPNPNNGSFTINLGFENKSDVMVNIYDITGKQVYAAQSNQSSIEFNMPDLIPGLYIVKLNGESVNETIKFIKE